MRRIRVLRPALAWPSALAFATALVAGIACTATPGPAPTAEPVPVLEVPSRTVSAAAPAGLPLLVAAGGGAVSQGDAIGIAVQWRYPGAPPESVSGTFRGEALRFVVERDRAWALAGVEPWTEARPEPLQVTVRYQDGHREEAHLVVPITAVAWPELALAFDADTSRLLAPDLVAREAERVNAVYRAVYPVRLWDGPFTVPTPGSTTSPFGERRSYGGGPPGQWHLGTDIAAPVGQLVRAANAGVVALAEPLQVRGNTVIIDHGMGVTSSYLHLAHIRVQPGQRVAKGDIIGTVGSTGLSTGPHLHWEQRVRGVATNPLEWTRRVPGLEAIAGQ